MVKDYYVLESIVEDEGWVHPTDDIELTTGL